MAKPRKPARLHVLEGTARTTRLLERVNELDIPAGDVGPAPDWFDPDAIETWDRITKHEKYSQVLTPLHREPLIQYCALWSQRVKVLRGDPEARKMSTMDVQVLNSLTQHFGLTPASQAKVNLPSKPQASKFAAFKRA